MARVVVRVWLADRPGALGLVASRIGGVRGEILGIEILERGAGRAFDELVVELPDSKLIELLIGEINAVDGVDVEDVRPARHALHDPRLDALETVALLVRAVTRVELLTVLVGHAKADLEAAWVAVVDVAGSAVVVADGEAPSGEWLTAFIASSQSSDNIAAGDTGPDDVAWAPLADAGLDLVLGRRGLRLRARERHQLIALVRVADLRWSQLDEVIAAER